MQDVLSKFVRYFMTGGVAAIVDAGGFALLHYVGMSTMPAAATSFTAAAVANYQLSSRFVFDSQPIKRQFMKFFLVALIGLAINVAITVFLMNTFEAIYPIVAKVMAIGITFVVNFLLNMYIVFK